MLLSGQPYIKLNNMKTKVIICALMLTAGIAAASAQENAPATKPVDLRALRAKADAGNSDALLQLGVLCLGGYDVEADTLRAVGYLQRAADKGNIEAMYDLGLCYIDGSRAVARDTEKGISLVRRAAENGFAIAQTCMGKICEQGTPCLVYSLHAKFPLYPVQMLKEAGGFFGCGGETYGVVPYLKNDADALRWITLAADSGEPVAMNELVRIYAKGYCGATIDPRKSLDWLMRAAENDISEAQCRLGRYYLNGYNNLLEPDQRKALEWFIRAADNGSADGAANAAAIYGGLSDLKGEQNIELAVLYSMRAANAYKGFNDKDFIDIGISILGSICANHGEELSPELASDALACLRTHAEKGDNNAQYYLAHVYFVGTIVDKNDKRGMYWLRLAMENGSEAAKLEMGEMYFKGNAEYGITQDRIYGAELLRQLAQNGNIEAQDRLGFLLTYDSQNVQDRKLAKEMGKEGMYWLHTAAEQGSARACWYLSMCYQLGTGTYANPSKAKQWTHEAARRGSREAIEFIENMNKKGIDY